jgi:UDP-N-acetylglucosamine diphosphorylase / glucose-1-phosphate thymidylyltransferase / UDP-N-acetylgalactosamine diphosphorylase / glucosamine-1-phosphate N-acetyltransferase / galactosamine-1-phosphate N-acetyltransferase
MDRVIIFEDPGFKNLLPLVYWRGCFQLRCGRTDLLTKIMHQLKVSDPILFVRPELAQVVAEQTPLAVNSDLKKEAVDLLLINGRWLANRPLPELPLKSFLQRGNQIVAARIPFEKTVNISPNNLVQPDFLLTLLEDCRPIQAGDDIILINYPWDLVQQNKAEIVRECDDSTKAGKIYPGVHLLDEKNIHIGPGTSIKPGTVLDAEEGPVWIDDNVRILPNIVIQGPCYIGPNCLIQSGAHIREGSSIGPVCKVGGEVEDSILQGYSNKQHYGFLGHSYLAEWINCGAGMTNSDLKNTYGPIRVSVNGSVPIDTGLIFVGLTVGDYSKIGINVSFPSGAVVGTASNVITSRHAPKFVPSFFWLTDDEKSDCNPDEAVKVAVRSMARRKLELTDARKRLFLALPEITRKYETRL